MVEQARLLDRFCRYVRCGSESRNERAFCEMIESELRLLGLTVYRDEVGERCGSNGFNVQAFLPGEGEPLLLCAHLDTVPPGEGIEPVVENGIIRSAGSTVLGSDDKSGVAAIMEALHAVTENKLSHRPIEVLFTVCEELGMLGARYADYSRFQSKEGVIFDSSKRGGIIHLAPAMICMHVAFTGKSAHAACAPENGIHAVKAAARAVDRIPCGYVGDESVMNINNFLAPGKTNVVPGAASFDMEIRSFSEETLAALRADAVREIADACAAYGATYTIEEERQSDVQYKSPDAPLVQNLLSLFRAEGVEAEVKSTFGGCDATGLSAHGILAVNIGTGMQNVHGVEEFIAVNDLLVSARIALALICGE